MLTCYRRGEQFWVRGRLADGRYIRRSLGTPDEAVAAAKSAEIERRARQRAVLGRDAPRPEDELSFAAAVILYPARPREALYLRPIVREIGASPVRELTGASIKALARKLYPLASADTWTRQVVTPVRAVVNHAHELGKAPPLRVKAFTRSEAMQQDRRRGRMSRKPKLAGSWDWLDRFRAMAKSRRNPYLAAIALFMFTTAARPTQACGVRRPQDVDLAAARLFLPEAKGHPAQWVAITGELVVDLANMPPRRGRAFGYKSRSSLYGAWATTCRLAGIPYIPPHSAGRHGFGTEMIVRQGLDPVTVAAAGRWSSPRVPLETYAHSEDAAAKISAALARGRDAARTNPVQPQPAPKAKLLKG